MEALKTSLLQALVTTAPPATVSATTTGAAALSACMLCICNTGLWLLLNHGKSLLQLLERQHCICGRRCSDNKASAAAPAAQTTAASATMTFDAAAAAAAAASASASTTPPVILTPSPCKKKISRSN
jgi:hypothetical protein